MAKLIYDIRPQKITRYIKAMRKKYNCGSIVDLRDKHLKAPKEFDEIFRNVLLEAFSQKPKPHKAPESI